MLVVFVLVAILLILVLISAASGEIALQPGVAIKALFGQGDDYSRRLIWSLRVPRIFAGAAIGAALSISGLMSATAMRNPLADSGVLGIQAGATIGALVTLLALPGLAGYLPLAAFAGGIAAYLILIAVSSGMKGNQPGNIVLSGIAINAIATSAIGAITLLNVYKVRDAMSWLNGSLSAVSFQQMSVTVGYLGVLIVLAAILIPLQKLLLLDDDAIVNLGHRPGLIRLVISGLAVFLAAVSVAFTGIIAFLGIIAPQLARRIVGHNLSWLFPASALCGAILVVGTDLFQRLFFAPIEIPVGMLIGILGAPLFIVLSRRR